MRFHEFFEEAEGGLSASRLNLIVWSLGTFGIWAFASVKAMSLVAIPESVIVMIGVVTAGKVVQRFSENGTSTAK